MNQAIQLSFSAIFISSDLNYQHSTWHCVCFNVSVERSLHKQSRGPIWCKWNKMESKKRRGTLALTPEEPEPPCSSAISSPDTNQSLSSVSTLFDFLQPPTISALEFFPARIVYFICFCSSCAFPPEPSDHQLLPLLLALPFTSSAASAK